MIVHQCISSLCTYERSNVSVKKKKKQNWKVSIEGEFLLEKRKEEKGKKKRKKRKGLHAAGSSSVYIRSTCKRESNTCHAHKPRPMVYGNQVDSKWGDYQSFRYPLVLVSFERSCGLHVFYYTPMKMCIRDVTNRNRAPIFKYFLLTGC